jgi:hypothetical protein
VLVSVTAGWPRRVGRGGLSLAARIGQGRRLTERVDSLDYRFGNATTLKAGDTDTRPPVSRIVAKVNRTFLEAQREPEPSRPDHVRAWEGGS